MRHARLHPKLLPHGCSEQKGVPCRLAAGTISSFRCCPVAPLILALVATWSRDVSALLSGGCSRVAGCRQGTDSTLMGHFGVEVGLKKADTSMNYGGLGEESYSMKVTLTLFLAGADADT